jgi:hypothetical protein
MDAYASWNGNSHSWILKDGHQICPPTDVQEDCMKRHAEIMKSNPVRFILFPADNESTQRETKVDTLRLRTLAYLLGGIGGTQQSRSPAWLFINQKVSLAWDYQGSDHKLDFTTPWRMCMWQPSRDLTLPIIQPNATPIPKCSVKAQIQQTHLHTLSKQARPMDIIPDGACPTALQPFLARIGGYTELSTPD